MIEFFSFMGCIIACAIFGITAFYIALFILVAFILLTILNKKYKKENLNSTLSAIAPFIYGIGLFIVIIGVLKLPQLSNEVSSVIINSVNFLGAFLGGLLMLCFVFALIQGLFRKK